MAKTDIGRVQGGGIFLSTANSSNSVNISTVSPADITPLVGDSIIFLNGDIRRVESVNDQVLTCGEVIASFKGLDGKDGIDGKNGVDGKDGIDGKDGEKGARGPGATFSYANNILRITTTE